MLKNTKVITFLDKLLWRSILAKRELRDSNRSDNLLYFQGFERQFGIGFFFSFSFKVFSSPERFFLRFDPVGFFFPTFQLRYKNFIFTRERESTNRETGFITVNYRREVGLHHFFKILQTNTTISSKSSSFNTIIK